jgi:hypothetical protein
VLGAAPPALAKLTDRAYSGREGLTLLVHGGLRAYFGDASRPRAKWAALALVLGSERSAGASYVDVRVPERPAAGVGTAGVGPAASGSAAGATPAARSLSEATVAALAAGLPTEGSAKAPAGSAAAEEEEGIKPRGGGEGPAQRSSEGSAERGAQGPAQPSSEGSGERGAETGASSHSEGH